MASFGKYTSLFEEPNYFTEPTYMLFVRVTYENAQSAGLAVGQYLKVKTGVLQCTTGHPTTDALVHDRIDTLLPDATPDMVHVRLSHRLQYAAKFLGAQQAMTALHEAQAKVKRPQEPVMDVTEKMMQWDADDPLLQPKRPKLDPDSTSINNKTKKTSHKDPRPLDTIKHSTPTPPPASLPAKPSARPKMLTPARRGAQ